MYGETVTVFNRIATGVDRGNATTYGFDAGTVVSGVAVAPIMLQTVSGEANEIGRDSNVQSRWRLYFPPGVSVNAYSRVQVRGELYDADGEPGDWRSPFTQWEPGIELLIRKVDG
jgi:hypothetical protein